MAGVQKLINKQNIIFMSRIVESTDWELELPDFTFYMPIQALNLQ